MKNSIILFMAVALLLGCSPDDSIRRPGSNNNPDDTQTTDGNNNPDTQDGDSGFSNDSQNDTNVCEETPFSIEREAGRLMILQDFSGSMTAGNPSRWSIAKEALKNLMQNPNFQDIEFGFDYFPDDADCNVSTLQMDCAPDNGPELIETYNPLNNALTPLYCALDNFNDAAYAPGFLNPDKSAFLLLVSDGQPSCTMKECKGSLIDVNPSDMATVTSQLYNNHQIKTFAIGFQYTSSDNPQFLRQVATSGETGYTDYIPADDLPGLESALEQVAGAVISCTFEIKTESASADPEKVNFYFDDDTDAIPMDEGCAQGIGWQWTDQTHTSIEFCEQACEKLKSGEVEEVTAKFGCSTILV